MRRVVLVSTFLLAALAGSACGAPSSFDGVTGGTKEDDSITAPRQMSPVSVSLVSTARPRFQWEMTSALTGAVVELSRTRDFKGEVKRYPGTGNTLAVSEDLDLGVWFWRLEGAAGSSVGTTPSPVWEIVVRGPAAHGTSDAPSRSMVDMNADGEPDLLIAGNLLDDGTSGAGSTGVSTTTTLGVTAGSATPSATAPSSPVVMFYGGDPNGAFSAGPTDGYYGTDQSPYTGPITIGAGTDFDGDGFTDVIESGSAAFTESGVTKFETLITYATPAGADTTFDQDRMVGVYTGDYPTAIPLVREAGDVDGDGYGDGVIGQDGIGFVVLGGATGKTGYSPVVPVEPDDPSTHTGVSRAAFGGFDANGDGLSDTLFSYSDDYDPLARALVAPGDRAERVGDATMIDLSGAKTAIAFAAGDFNGDGLDDVAFTSPTPSTGSSRVCVWYGDQAKLLVQGGCITAPAGETDFGASLTAADLEGDGIDELLVSTTSNGTDGIRLVHAVAADTMSVTPIGPAGVGVRLTTIWPGRPGMARWAAAAADGSRVVVFEGSNLKETIMPPPTTSSGFGRGLR